MHKGDAHLSAMFGLFLRSIGVYVLAWTRRLLLGASLAELFSAVLGANMLYASYTGKRSWLSRVGPLP